MEKSLVEAKERLRVEILGMVRGAETVGSHDFPLGSVPNEKVQVVIVKPVEVKLSTRTFTSLPERDLSQPANLTHRIGDLEGASEQNL
jgi:hypothetical protein